MKYSLIFLWTKEHSKIENLKDEPRHMFGCIVPVDLLSRVHFRFNRFFSGLNATQLDWQVYSHEYSFWYFSLLQDIESPANDFHETPPGLLPLHSMVYFANKFSEQYIKVDTTWLSSNILEEWNSCFVAATVKLETVSPIIKPRPFFFSNLSRLRSFARTATKPE